MKLSLDLKEAGPEVRRVWSFGVNTCHAVLNTRADLNSHLVMASEIGLRYVRSHNIFSEQVGLYQIQDGIPKYDFTTVDAIYDNIIAAGMLPFIELGFCPPALKSGDTTVAAYHANTSVPSSMRRWSELVTCFAEHLIDRYGLDMVARWYFEVWNEPDIVFFAGDQAAYFELYDHSAVAIKAVSERLRIGGPATARCAWIPEFLEHLERGSEVTDGAAVPCDFISTHAYPSDIAFVDSDEGDVQLQQSNIMYKLYSTVRSQIDASRYRGLPLFMGEWNSSAGPYAANHDEKNNGAFLAKTLCELRNVIDGSLYWNVSDIYEEAEFHYTPFHGGYGIFNVNSIPKSSYNAFAFLDRLRGAEVPVQLRTGSYPEGCGALACYEADKRRLSILLYHYQEPESPTNSPWQVDLRLDGLEVAAASLSASAVNDRGGSPYELWIEMGKPDYLTIAQHRKLLDRSAPEIRRSCLRAAEDGSIQLAATLDPGDLQLLQLTM